MVFRGEGGRGRKHSLYCFPECDRDGFPGTQSGSLDFIMRVAATQTLQVFKLTKVKQMMAIAPVGVHSRRRQCIRMV